MINRRIIRGKVLQQLFAYKSCEAANIEITQEKIIQTFQPDLNSLEPQDAKKLEGYGKLTLLLFQEYLKDDKINTEDTQNEQITKSLKDSVVHFKKLNLEDKNRIIKKAVADAENLKNYYLLILLLLIEIAEKLAEVKKITSLKKNHLIQILNNHAEFNQEILKNKISWKLDEDIVSELLIQVSNDTEIKSYFGTSSHDLEADKTIVVFIIKNILFKNAHFEEYFNALDYTWAEDKASVKDLLLTVIKEAEPNGNFQLPSISKNWTDDSEFMKELYSLTLENDRYFEGLIAPKLKNWDISRLTSTDRIMMKMCLTELIHFHNIPVKVSINEYIELSKRFSTPKSKTLINGVLDNISNELQANKTIKKSGRGLIDNK
jgi:N utilization substance protein B